jgi:hypothetical protein
MELRLQPNAQVTAAEPQHEALVKIFSLKKPKYNMLQIRKVGLRICATTASWTGYKWDNDTFNCL